MRPQVFKLEEALKIAKYIKGRHSAWVGQADFRKLELKHRNHSGNCQCWSGKRDGIEDLWNNRRNFLTFALGVVNGRGCYYSSPFQRFYGNSLHASQLHSTQTSTVRGLLFSELKCSLRSQALYFLYLSHPPETGREGKRSYDRTTLPACRRLLFPLLHAEAR